MKKPDEDSILYLCEQDVRQTCADLDTVSIIREVFKLHGSGRTHLPDEAYLGWKNAIGEPVRSLNMPGYVGNTPGVAGTKIINGNIANPQRGLPRASGLTVLFDPISVRPCCIMEGAYISSLRTASVTALAVDLFKSTEINSAALIGAGVLAQTHIQVLLKHLPHLRVIRLFDLDALRILQLQQALAPTLKRYPVSLEIASSAEEAIRPSQLIVPVTTTTTGYIPFHWLQPGSILVNVSLDDALPDVVFEANLVIVDDWNLVKNDPRRLIGRMYREGKIIGPGESEETIPGKRRKIDAELGDIVNGTKNGRTNPQDIVLVNPFGLAIEDVALAGHIYHAAQNKGLGMYLPR